MERTVEGDKWVTRGWISVLEVLYKTDVVVSLAHIRTSDTDYAVVEQLSSDSEILTETELTENQAIIELNHLLEEGLVDYIRPFEDTDFVVYRLTDAGYQVAHERKRTEMEERWRSESRKIDVVLTIATGFLAAGAFVQVYLAYRELQSPSQWLLLTGATLVVILTISLIVGRRGVRGPSFW
ncbi:hypothetical protein [Halapricum hydrolyticum]|uniref:Uncharacterized protein n=1 Tax=Halapricum hydrolyticum TaxID=2979991 RepID=A0AAE3IBS1_9EURY|nr:hypothetical protein [Halapricum hydrolyticum]MCU4717577.1 hypothetical protein [Halapricum hydrolyticum]MCU4726894.1 hypothetical protein [Halapricum hydrolyticum]